MTTKTNQNLILWINLWCFSAHPSLSDSGPVSLPAHLPNSYLPKEPPPRATESLASMTLPLRGPMANSSGSPHLGNMMHPPMPPSCIMEELQRAFASKNRQEMWVLRLTPYFDLYMLLHSHTLGLWQTRGVFFSRISLLIGYDFNIYDKYSVTVMTAHKSLI